MRLPPRAAVEWIGADVDGVVDDAGDDLFVSETFASTLTTFVHDNSGNLVDDGRLDYTYDAWHRMVSVIAKQDASITIQTAQYDGLGRRIKKVVTNSGDLDGTWVYYYNGQRMIEAVDGSANLLVQTYHGLRYIDEVVAME
ncbi:MAG: hypothetical protein IIA44_02705, partial [Acidobacteria bacterium]|nr:hypothetical protein [Acidobacteriota bacterium]